MTKRPEEELAEALADLRRAFADALRPPLLRMFHILDAILNRRRK